MTDDDFADDIVTTADMPNIPDEVLSQLDELKAPRGTGKTVKMVQNLFAACKKSEVTEALVVVANAGQMEELADVIKHVYDEAQRELDDAGDPKEGRPPGPRLERSGLVLFRGTHIFIVPVNDLERAERGMPSGTPRFVDHFALQGELIRLLRPTL